MATRFPILKKTLADKELKWTLSKISDNLKVQDAVNLLNLFHIEPGGRDFRRTLMMDRGFGIEPSAERMAIAALRKLEKLSYKEKQTLLDFKIEVDDAISNFEERYKGKLAEWRKQEEKTDIGIRDEIKRIDKGKEREAKFHRRALAKVKRGFQTVTAFAKRLPKSNIRRR